MRKIILIVFLRLKFDAMFGIPGSHLLSMFLLHIIESKRLHSEYAGVLSKIINQKVKNLISFIIFPRELLNILFLKCTNLCYS